MTGRLTADRDHRGLPLSPFNLTGWTPRKGILTAACLIFAYFAIFQLPYSFPPTEQLVSASYAFGFNNSVAIAVITLLLGLTLLYGLLSGSSLFCDPVLSFKEPGANATRLSRSWFLMMSGLYGLLTAGMYWYSRRAATAWITWESRHFLHRIQLVETYGLHLYGDIQAEYGPALMYTPIYIHGLVAPLGVSVQGAYFLCHLLMNVAGLWCLWYLLMHLAAPSKVKSVAFVLIGVAGFAPYMGLNGVVLRYTCPFAALLFGHRTWITLRERPSPFRSLTLILMVAALSVVNVLLSPEIALVFVLGWLAYAALWIRRRDWRLVSLTAPALAGTALLCYFFLPDTYYGSLL
jgi:hypothetical protein